MTVRYLQSSPFPRYGPSPLQVTFSLPNIAGKVLLKSFQTFYEQVHRKCVGGTEIMGRLRGLK